MAKSTSENNLEFLCQFNRVKAQGRPIYEHFAFLGYSLWSFFQQLIWAEINQNGAVIVSQDSRPCSLKIFLLRFFAVLVSFFSFLILKIKRPDVFIFTEDVTALPDRADPRIGRIYEFLKSQKINYGEIVHTRLNRKLVPNFFKRRRPVIYSEAIDFCHALFGWPKRTRFFKPIDFEAVDFGEFSQDEKKFVMKLLETFSQYAEASAVRIIFFKKIFHLLGAKHLLAIDDMRYVNELLLAAKLSQMKTTLFQHGRFTKYQAGWINYNIPPEKCIAPDNYFVWNEYWRNKLLQLSPTFKLNETKVAVGGRASVLGNSFKYTPAIKGDTTTVMLPYEELAAPDDIRKLVEKLIRCPSMAVIFKLRKDLPESEQLKKMKLDDIRNENFQALADLNDDVLKKTDLVIGTYSTLLYEMIEAGKPVGVIKSRSIQADDLVEDQMASFVDFNANNLCDQLKNLANQDEAIFKKHAESLAVSIKIEDTLDTLF